MLTLAAMHVLNDTSDLYFTGLQAGAFAAKKPDGEPCDFAFPCHHSGLQRRDDRAWRCVCIVGSVVIATAAFIYRRRRNKFWIMFF